MRFIYYGAGPIATRTIRRWSEENGIPVECVPEGICEENAGLAKGFDAACLYLSRDMRTSESLYRRLHEYGVKTLSLTATGIDGLNRSWATRYGLHVTNVPSYSPTSVGHFALMDILMMLRGVPAAERTTTTSRALIGWELADVTVGVLGTGRIGSVVANAVLTLGGSVIAHSRSVNPDLADKVRYVGFDEFLATSDILTIHIPLTSRTHHLFDDAAFSGMKEGSRLVNTARGSIVDTEALLRALDSGRISGAALDTIEEEERYMSGIWTDNPLYQRLLAYPNVTITPHIAYYTTKAVSEIAAMALQNARDVITTGSSASIIL